MENLTKIERENLIKLKLDYNDYLDKLENKINSINSDFASSDELNPIEYTKRRIKTDESICNKLKKDGLEITIDNIKENIHDVAGIRIVCSFKSDIDKIKERIEQDKDIKILREKDYINNPKSTGYRSLHMNVTKNSNEKNIPEAEIQIRTIAMDMWASLEHKLLYKSKYGLLYKDMNNKMVDFAKKTNDIDILMEKLIELSNKYNGRKKYTPKDVIGLNEIANTRTSKYETALNQVESIIKEIKENLTNEKDINPIEHIETRIKNPLSITKKLESNGYSVTKDNMSKHIHDIAGIRIVCSFMSDLEEIKSIIQDKFAGMIIKESDYINNPKDNGYRSYHLNVLVPIKTLDKTEYVEVEIQLRTIAMDMWASLEHKISYQKDGEIPEEIKHRLKDISNFTNEVDEKMAAFIEYSKKIPEIDKPKILTKK